VSITLSEWKDSYLNNYQHLYESPIIVATVGNLIQFLRTSSINIIELTTLYDDDRNIIIKYENNKIVSVD